MSSQNSTSNDTEQDSKKQNLPSTVEVTPPNQGDIQKKILTSTSNQTTGLENLVGAVNNFQSEQSDTQPSLTANQITPTFGPFSNVTEIQKRKYLQQLILLLHAYKCPKSESTNSEGESACSLKQCQGMKRILGHIRKCPLNKSCSVPDCTSSKSLVIHFKDCSLKDCSLCVPIKEAHAKQKNLKPDALQKMCASKVRSLPSNNFSLTNSNTQSQDQASSLESEQISKISNETQPQLTPQQPSDIYEEQSDQNERHSDQNQQQPDFNRHQSDIQLSDVNQQQSNVYQQAILNNVSEVNVNPTNFIYVGDGYHASPNPSVVNSRTNQMPPFFASVTDSFSHTHNKTWHHTVSAELRTHLIVKIIGEVLTVLNRKDLNDPNDPLLMSIIQYARKNEAIFFVAANSKEEYYHLLVELIYQIQRKKLTSACLVPEIERQQNGTLSEPACHMNSACILLPTVSVTNLASGSITATKQ